MLYLVFKLIHVVAVILFLGNITTGVFWKAHADRTRDPRIIGHMLEGLIASDRWFTIPAVIVLVLGGVGAAMAGGLRMLHVGWVLWPIVLFMVSGFAFGRGVSPRQRQMAKLFRSAPDERDIDWTTYHRLTRDWQFWGTIALLAPAIAVAIMVLKPNLPSL
jgi:uncharacterized membrane protein